MRRSTQAHDTRVSDETQMGRWSARAMWVVENAEPYLQGVLEDDGHNETVNSDGLAEENTTRIRQFMSSKLGGLTNTHGQR